MDVDQTDSLGVQALVVENPATVTNTPPDVVDQIMRDLDLDAHHDEFGMGVRLEHADRISPRPFLLDRSNAPTVDEDLHLGRVVDVLFCVTIASQAHASEHRAGV